jgi:WD40 repeat protein
LSTLHVERIDTFSGHRGPLYSIEQGANSLFYSAGSDGWVVSWNLAKPDLGKVVAQVEGSVYAMKFDAAENLLWVGQNNEGVHCISLQDQSRVFSLSTSGLSIFAIEFFGFQAWIAHSNGLISVVDRSSKELIKQVKASEKSVRCFSLLGEDRIAAGYSDGYIRIFDAQFQLLHAFQAHESTVFALQSRGGLLYSVGKDARIKDWKADFTLSQEVIGHIYAIHDVQISPNGQFMATASMDKTVKIWELGTLRLLKVLDASRHGGHKNAVNKLLWSSFDDLLVSASDDKNLSVWKIE